MSEITKRNHANSSHSRRPTLMLGELFVSAGVLTADRLEKMLRDARMMRMPIGRALVYTGTITEKELTDALALQTVARAKHLSLNFLVTAYNLVRIDDVALEQAIVTAQEDQDLINLSKLGILLRDAGIVSHDQFHEAVHHSDKTGVPVGRIMCYLGFVNEDVLAQALQLQTAIRLNQLTKEEAIARLQNSSPKFLEKLRDIAQAANSPMHRHLTHLSKTVGSDPSRAKVVIG
jgi:hypothetical protein